MSGSTLVFFCWCYVIFSNHSSNIPQPVHRRKSRGDVYADSAEKPKERGLTE